MYFCYITRHTKTWYSETTIFIFPKFFGSGCCTKHWGNGPPLPLTSGFSAGIPKMWGVGLLTDMARLGSCDLGLDSSVSLVPQFFFACPLLMAHLGFLTTCGSCWLAFLLGFWLPSREKAEEASFWKARPRTGTTPLVPCLVSQGASQGQAWLEGIGQG